MDKEIIFESLPICGITLIQSDLHCSGDVIIAQLAKQVLNTQGIVVIMSTVQNFQRYDALLKKLGINLNVMIQQKRIIWVDVLNLVKNNSNLIETDFLQFLRIIYEEIKQSEKNINVSNQEQELNEGYIQEYEQKLQLNQRQGQGQDRYQGQGLGQDRYQGQGQGQDQYQGQGQDQNQGKGQTFLFVDSLSGLRTLQIAFNQDEKLIFGFIETLMSLMYENKQFSGIIFNNWVDLGDKNEWFTESRADVVIKFELFDGPMHNIDGRIYWIFRNPKIKNYKDIPIWKIVCEKLQRSVLFQIQDAEIKFIDQPAL
eukprot:TRINITY_DN73169_c0_g1_i5.p1 TRINITY_DN73169_c0_g1~~TRINITY_DN73169_c0_g1_i5.p1  ORF type:complete len:313 (-),score=30.48 TRINITY_DN73169_c0_g1_i5:198-1136(-)